MTPSLVSFSTPVAGCIRRSRTIRTHACRSSIALLQQGRQVAEISPPAELHGQISNFSSTTGVVGVLVVSLVGAAFTSEPPSVRVHDEDPEVAKQRSESANASRAAAHARHELFKQLIPGKCTHICHKTMQL